MTSIDELYVERKEWQMGQYRSGDGEDIQSQLDMEMGPYHSGDGKEFQSWQDLETGLKFVGHKAPNQAEESNAVTQELYKNYLDGSWTTSGQDSSGTSDFST